MAFTGPGDTVPWVVWYETGSGRNGIRNERVFAAKAVANVAASQRGLTLASPSPISSSCTANPFNGDGSACQGGASGQAFFLFNDGAPGDRKLLAKAVG